MMKVKPYQSQTSEFYIAYLAKTAKVQLQETFYFVYNVKKNKRQL